MEILVDSISYINSNYEMGNQATKEKKKDTFDLFLEKSELKKAQEKKQEALLENLDFVARTGFTKEELERIKEILEELQKQRAESGQSQKIEDYIKNLKQDLQAAIFEVTGKRVDLDKDFINDFSKQQNNQNLALAKKSTDEELRLLDKLKNI